MLAATPFIWQMYLFWVLPWCSPYALTLLEHSIQLFLSTWQCIEYSLKSTSQAPVHIAVSKILIMYSVIEPKYYHHPSQVYFNWEELLNRLYNCFYWHWFNETVVFSTLYKQIECVCVCVYIHVVYMYVCVCERQWMDFIGWIFIIYWINTKLKSLQL